MPVAKELRTNPALEAQVFWYKYRKEIAILLVLAIVAIIAIAGYRLYRDRREATAATFFSGAKTPAAYEEVINRYGDTAAAASAYLLLADSERKQAKYSEANATLLKFLEKFPQRELVSAARMAMAANLEAMGQQDEAFATYQQIASANAGSFNAPMALIEQVHILQEKKRIDDAKRNTGLWPVRPAGFQTRCLTNPRKHVQRSKTSLGAQTGKSVFRFSPAKTQLEH